MQGAQREDEEQGGIVGIAKRPYEEGIRTVSRDASEGDVIEEQAAAATIDFFEGGCSSVEGPHHPNSNEATERINKQDSAFRFSQKIWGRKTNDDASSDDDSYHSPVGDSVRDENGGEEDQQARVAGLTSSKYDYDVNWDMIGNAGKENDSASSSGTELPQQALQTEDKNLNSNATEADRTACSLADAAMASGLINMEESAPGDGPQSFASSYQLPTRPRTMSNPTPRRSNSSRHSRPPGSPYISTHRQASHDEIQRGEAFDAVPDSVLNEVRDSSSTLRVPSTAESTSVMNESISNHSSSSSSNSSFSQRIRRRPLARRPMNSTFLSSSTPSALDNPLTTRSPQASSESSHTGLRASLDTGMMTLRRWIRARTTVTDNSRTIPRSSVAARRMQEDIQLGDEDFFVLSGQRTASLDGIARPYDDSSLRIMYPPPIAEEEDGARQRALSEPGMRTFFHNRMVSSRWRRRHGGSDSLQDDDNDNDNDNDNDTATQRSGSVARPTVTNESEADEQVSVAHPDESVPETTTSGNAFPTNNGRRSAERQASDVNSNDPLREARHRWIRINRRFQCVITIVALLFGLLLFSILVCWIVLTSAYVIAFDTSCDVPLKTYFWLATFQLILDVFRSDIMRNIFRWDSNSRERIPTRVIVYNIAYLIYAMMVLRLGIQSVFLTNDATCKRTAPEFYQTSTVFVSLSIAAWSTLVLGYLIPFCVVAIILTRNGYSPSSDARVTTGGAAAGLGGVFNPYSNMGAPPGCVDQMRVVLLEEFPDEYPRECCICMGDFAAGELIVATECQHVFHKRCCQEWLQHARTCPVCRTDIPSSLQSEEGTQADGEDRTTGRTEDRNSTRTFGSEEFHQEVVSLLRVLRQHEERIRQQQNSSGTNDSVAPSSDDTGVEMVASSLENAQAVDSVVISAEEGRSIGALQSMESIE